MVIALIAFSATAVINPSPQTTSDSTVTAGFSAQADPSPSLRSSTYTTVAGSSVLTTPTSSRLGAVIRQAEATWIAIPAIGYRAAVEQMATDANGDVNPSTLQDTYRITNRGTLPGTKADNTVYMACHSSSRGFAPCNLVFAQAKPGQHVLVTTPAGTLDYVIQATRLYAKTGSFKNSNEVRAAVPGRLVLVTCFQKNNRTASTQNFVVFAHLAQ